MSDTSVEPAKPKVKSRIGTRGKLILAGLSVVMLLAGWQGFRFWWYHGYSRGERTGLLRKVTLKGTPLCRYVEGEMALIGSMPGQSAEIWKFSIDGNDKNPLFTKLEVAARKSVPVTLKYRQDLKSWWRCTPHEYFITDIAQ